MVRLYAVSIYFTKHKADFLTIRGIIFLCARLKGFVVCASEIATYPFSKSPSGFFMLSKCSGILS